ncbi:MAG: hypothetical protein ABI729_01730, partial [Chitinophagales bacterium]
DHNHINKIPDWIGELKALRELHLDADFFSYPVDKINMLPASVGNLKQLEVLSMRDQVVRALPATISRCSHLKND